MTARRVRVEVRGRVQGVYYRASTQERARELGLTGWVRNEPRAILAGDDASVTLEAQGPADAVSNLVDWCRQGPPAARVADLAVTDIPPRSDESEFRIARTPPRAS